MALTDTNPPKFRTHFPHQVDSGWDGTRWNIHLDMLGFLAQDDLSASEPEFELCALVQDTQGNGVEEVDSGR